MTHDIICPSRTLFYSKIVIKDFLGFILLSGSPADIFTKNITGNIKKSRLCDGSHRASQYDEWLRLNTAKVKRRTLHIPSLSSAF